MSLRSSLRTTVLAAVAAGAVCVPATSAFADSSPTAVPASPSQSAKPTAAPSKAPSEEPSSAPSVVPSDAPRGGVAAGDRTAPAVRPATVPRGGVAAGERPAGTSGDNTAAVMGSAVAALLVAGAGTVVLRRRSTGRSNG
ncbi:sortase-dependent protein [Streptomyces sp. NPDC087428]|uniref:sortase-dependent protein n=1 Tax=Streptomyces sp. NPDC087428 TaxID=3365788 RepID=UPI003819AE1B